MIEIHSLTKRYGEKVAVDAISATVQTGVVTGFLGPNGAGKSTTMRAIVGLDHPSSGRALVNGHAYVMSSAPIREVGVLLDAKAAHPKRTALNHLRSLAATHGIPRSQIDRVIGLTGLDTAVTRRVGDFSLGMGQRLGIACALLGDPATLILDEPVNGLDPEGVVWVRTLAKQLAREGRTVFISSHLMSEMAQTADHLIVLGRGRILADAPIGEVIGDASRSHVAVTSPDAVHLAELIVHAGAEAKRVGPEQLEVYGLSVSAVGELAGRAGITLRELAARDASLEDAYLELTRDEVEYRSEAMR